MKVITEALIRAELKATEPEVYYIPEGKILSPAAREYLQGLQIEIDFERNKGKAKPSKAAPSPSGGTTPRDFVARTKIDADALVPKGRTLNEDAPKAEAGKLEAPKLEEQVLKPKYVDYETGAGYVAKPEHMTQLRSNLLVDKCHPRIKYRGKIDKVQAMIVNAQCVIHDKGGSQQLIDDLGNVLDVVRNMMRCEVLDEPLTNEYIIGLNHAELREHSHFPMKYYKIKQMLLPDYTMGIEHSLLNLIRTSIREAEVLAVDAFRQNRTMDRSDIVQELNRLSSALHIMMCKFLAGGYDEK